MCVQGEGPSGPSHQMWLVLPESSSTRQLLCPNASLILLQSSLHLRFWFSERGTLQFLASYWPVLPAAAASSLLLCISACSDPPEVSCCISDLCMCRERNSLVPPIKLASATYSDYSSMFPYPKSVLIPLTSHCIRFVCVQREGPLVPPIKHNQC